MNPSPPLRTPADLLAHIRQLSAAVSLVPHREMHDLLKGLGSDESFSPTEWAQVVDFSADQLSRWQVQWLFSPAESPDTVAAAESEGWRALWKVYSDAPAKEAPGVRVRETCGLVEISRVIETSIEYRRTQPIGIRVTSEIFFILGRVLSRVGLKSVGRRLLARGMYPPKHGRSHSRLSTRPRLSRGVSLWSRKSTADYRDAVHQQILAAGLATA